MKKYKALIYIVVGLVITAALTYFVYIPQIKSSFLIWAGNMITKEEILTLEQKKANINELKKQKKEAEDLVNSLAQMLPAKKESGELLIEVEAIAIKSNVNLADIKFTEEKAATASTTSTSSEGTTGKTTSVKGASTEKFKEMTFEMTVQGSYGDVINFLRDLEKMNRAITIDKYDLSETKGTVQASFKGKAFYKNG